MFMERRTRRYLLLSKGDAKIIVAMKMAFGLNVS